MKATIPHSSTQDSATLTAIVRAEQSRALAASRQRLAQRAADGSPLSYHAESALMAPAPVAEDSQLERLAWSIARTLARFHTGGRVALLTRGHKTISRAEAHTTGKRVRAKISDGTGGTLSEQDTTELYLAARAALLAEVMAGKDLRSAWRTGANAARRTLYVQRREPTYSDADAATRAHDRAHRRFAESFETESGAPTAHQPQPHAAEFLPCAHESHLDARAVTLRAYVRARAALRAYWETKRYPRAGKDRLRDFATLRTQTRRILAGEVIRQAKRDNAAEYKQLREFAERCQAGFSLIEKREELESLATPAAPTSHVSPLTSHKVQTVTLPRTRAEHWEHDLCTGQLPLASRLLSREPATSEQLASLAAHFGRQ